VTGFSERERRQCPIHKPRIEKPCAEKTPTEKRGREEDGGWRKAVKAKKGSKRGIDLTTVKREGAADEPGDVGGKHTANPQKGKRRGRGEQKARNRGTEKTVGQERHPGENA